MNDSWFVRRNRLSRVKKFCVINQRIEEKGSAWERRRNSKQMPTKGNWESSELENKWLSQLIGSSVDKFK